jgi:hypothetical protein
MEYSLNLDVWVNCEIPNKRRADSVLTPQGLPVSKMDKWDLDSVTWSHNFLRFFKTFCEHARDKLCGSTNSINFRPTNQKLWGNKNFRRSLGRAGTCWSQPTRANHLCKKMWVGGRRGILARWSLGHLRRASGQPLVANWPWSFDC